MPTKLVTLSLVSLATLLPACALPHKPPMRIAAAADHVVVRVDGQGVVTGFSEQLACDAASGVGACEARRADVSTPHLTATPAPGWALARWDAEPLEVSLAEGTVRTVQYTAVFVRERSVAAAP